MNALSFKHLPNWLIHTIHPTELIIFKLKYTWSLLCRVCFISCQSKSCGEDYSLELKLLQSSNELQVGLTRMRACRDSSPINGNEDMLPNYFLISIGPSVDSFITPVTYTSFSCCDSTDRRQISSEISLVYHFKDADDAALRWFCNTCHYTEFTSTALYVLVYLDETETTRDQL